MSTTKRKQVRIILENGKPAAGILDIAAYRKLLERPEDAQDLKMLERMRKKPLKFRKLDEFLAENRPRV
ncbi:MAG: type II toxin-antitoxin system Phd/YefM family antitoxin [Dehalococcoidia bacterium]|nr:type II toxin-antitoxin system Phd/YefM family antitoxin [Dehalococcoidia bacterium]